MHTKNDISSSSSLTYTIKYQSDDKMPYLTQVYM